MQRVVGVLLLLLLAVRMCLGPAKRLQPAAALQKTPAELGAALGGGGAEGERDGWRGGTIAAVVLLLLGAVGIGLYCLCFRKRGAAKTPGAAAQLTISTNASVPPPAQVGLPAGWTAAADPKSGQTYYISPKGEPTWTLPGAV